MECDLELGGEGEPIIGYKSHISIASEDVKCSECDRQIPSGSEHEVTTGDCDGEPFEAHTCMDCVHIAQALQTEGRAHGFLWAQLEDYGGTDRDGAFSQLNSACLARVETPSAKAYLQERYRKWLGLA